MPISTFSGGDDDDSDSGSTNSGSDSPSDKYSDSTPNVSTDSIWDTKIDFGSPYVIVATDRHGNIVKHKGAFGIKDDPDDWKRCEDTWRRRCSECNYSTDDHDRLRSHLRSEHDMDNIDVDDFKTETEIAFEKDIRVLFKKQQRTDWIRFCNLVQDQHSENPNEVFENEPERLDDLADQTYFPPHDGYDETHNCQICRQYHSSHHKYGSQDDEAIVEMKMQKHRSLHVCAHHTVEELAEHGFLK
jgi:hypothetical protein